jgi:hypothetical protein
MAEIQSISSDHGFLHFESCLIELTSHRDVTKKHDVTIHFLHQQPVFYFPVFIDRFLLHPQAWLRRTTYYVYFTNDNDNDLFAQAQ